jgi:hypothetical protein
MTATIGWVTRYPPILISRAASVRNKLRTLRGVKNVRWVTCYSPLLIAQAISVRNELRTLRGVQ